MAKNFPLTNPSPLKHGVAGPRHNQSAIQFVLWQSTWCVAANLTILRL
jgi:hypothetical protein